MRLGVLLTLLAFLIGCSGSTQPPVSKAAPTPSLPTGDPRFKELHTAMPKVAALFTPMGKPRPGDWLAAFHEDGQTFDEWLHGDPTLPTPERRKLYVLPLGHFSNVQLRVISITAGYLSAFYGLPVESVKPQPLNAAYPDARQSNYTHTRQVKTDFVLEKVLAPMLPKDAAALIAFTDQDLFPDETMAYVFGQASLDKRVGVWSLFRLRRRQFREVCTENYKDRRTRNWSHVLHEALHEIRMPDERHESTERNRSSPHRRVPGVHGKNMLAVEAGSCGTLQTSCRVLSEKWPPA